MVAVHIGRGPKRVWSSRVLEWSLMVALILGLAGVFWRQARVVQAQAEWATVRGTLGALRVAFVAEHVRRNSVPTQARLSPQNNPFELLERRPPNYQGEIGAGEHLAVRPGSWVFERDCVCVGYLPNDAEGFESASGDAMAWFAVSPSASGGLLLLSAKEAYAWQGQRID